MNIVFYYPSKVIGGAEYLFLNVANELAKKADNPVYFVDYKDGFSKTRLFNKVKPINYVKGNPVEIPANSVLVLQLNLINKIEKYFVFKGDYRPLLWSIHPNNLSGKLSLLNKQFVPRYFIKNCGRYINKLISDGDIIIMDEANVKSIKKTFLVDISDVKYVPVAIDDSRIRPSFSPRNINQDLIRFTWLGRLDSDKIPTLVSYINEIEELNKTHKASLSIIGTGNRLKELVSLRSRYNITIDFKGQLTGRELDDYIDNNVDIGLAMGTSILEFSKRGVPVILKGFVDKERPAGYYMDYLLTNEIKGYSLGSVDGVCLNNPYEGSFQDKVNLLIKNYIKLSKECYDYVKDNHTISHTADLFQNVVNNIWNHDNSTIIRTLTDRFDFFENIRMRKFNFSTMLKGVRTILFCK